MPQVVQQVESGTAFVPRELSAINRDKVSSWGQKIRSAHLTGEKATPDNYMDVS